MTLMKKNKSNEVWKQINWLSREKIVSLFESAGFAVFENEDIQDLREALYDNVESGDITLPDG